MRNVTALAVRPRYQKCFFIWDTLAKVSLYPRRSLQRAKMRGGGTQGGTNAGNP